MRRYSRCVPVVALVLALLIVIPLAGCGGQNSSVYKPEFMPASEKLAETSGGDFTDELYREALA